MIDLSIIILNYNTRDLALGCVKSIQENYPREVASGKFEVILADNASPDGSLAAFEKFEKQTKIKTFQVIDNKKNLGFAAGNNRAIPFAKGRYVLFLNPDTIVDSVTLSRMIEFMDKNKDAGAATCRIESFDGQFDQPSHRGFPTPWNAFTHFSRLEKVFPKTKLFGGYIQGFKDLSKIHEVDVISGAFLFVRRDAGERINWWDEEYFFYGEDIQFCFDLKKQGYKIYFVPDVSITHLGSAASGIRNRNHNEITADAFTKKKMQAHRFDAMRIFYEKNYKDHYPKFVNWIVHVGINLLHKKHSQ